MTMPTQELHAVNNTREFLRHLNRCNLTEIRKNPREVRERARACLRHYPWDLTTKKLWKNRIKHEMD